MDSGRWSMLGVPVPVASLYLCLTLSCVRYHLGCKVSTIFEQVNQLISLHKFLRGRYQVRRFPTASSHAKFSRSVLRVLSAFPLISCFFVSLKTNICCWIVWLLVSFLHYFQSWKQDQDFAKWCHLPTSMCIWILRNETFLAGRRLRELYFWERELADTPQQPPMPPPF